MGRLLAAGKLAKQPRPQQPCIDQVADSPTELLSLIHVRINHESRNADAAAALHQTRRCHASFSLMCILLDAGTGLARNHEIICIGIP